MGWARWAVAVIALPLASAWAGPVKAVETGGVGELHKCPSLFPTHFCRTYSHIKLPPRIVVGDTLPLTFGSNMKRFGFPVALIRLGDGVCTIYSDAEPDPDGDRLDVASCRAAPE